MVGLLGICNAGGHHVAVEDLQVCQITGETICYSCIDLERQEITADIYAERDAITAMDARLLAYNPEVVDFDDINDGVPF